MGLTKQDYIMFACIMIPVLVLTIIGVLWFEKQKKRKKNKMRKKDSGLDIFLLKVYMKLDNFFLTEDTLRKITKQVQSMSCYSPRDSYILAAKYMLMAMGIAAAFIIAAVLMFDDMVSVALCSSFGLVFASVMVDK